MKKVSIVMPIYGVENYLPQCIDSVLAQTYTNIEVILVNDGSPDNCGKIVDDYAEKDARIIPIHKKNGGYGSAINAGFDVATGDYIAIVETDDWVEADMIENLLDIAKIKPNSDIIKATFNRIQNEKITSTQSFKHLGELDVNNTLTFNPSSSLDFMLLESSIWTAIYKRSFLCENEIRMLETQGASYQDGVFKFMCYSASPEITLVDTPVYNYRVFAVGSSSASSDKALAMFNNYTVIKSYLEGKNIFSENMHAFYAHQCFDFVFHLNRLEGDAEKLFIEHANSVLAEMKKYEFDINNVEFSSDVNDYYSNTVKPILDYVESGRLSNKYKLKQRLKIFLKSIIGRA